jgi:SP family general alpha glucoside:H+ symporter-like MFS transporter
VYTYFNLPEPRGRTFAQLDVLFERRISARKFHKTEVDEFEENVDDKIMKQYDDVNSDATAQAGGVGSKA